MRHITDLTQIRLMRRGKTCKCAYDTSHRRLSALPESQPWGLRMGSPIRNLVVTVVGIWKSAGLDSPIVGQSGSQGPWLR